MNYLKNLFINRTLKHVLDGNKGSNILTVIVAAVLGAQIDFMKAAAGFQFKDADSVTEASKLVGVVVLAVYGYFVGKHKPATPET
jgi:hypothetical protein